MECYESDPALLYLTLGRCSQRVPLFSFKRVEALAQSFDSPSVCFPSFPQTPESSPQNPPAQLSLPHTLATAAHISPT